MPSKQYNPVSTPKPTAKSASQAQTRERLLKAALHCFGNHDYDGVSTRQIVEAAGANISAISYHFGGKRPLYLATAAFLAEKIHAAHSEHLEHVRAETERIACGPDDPAGCRHLLHNLLKQYATTLLTSEFGEDGPGFIFREQLQPTEAFDLLYKHLFEPMNNSISRLVALIRGIPPSHREVLLVTHALMGQIIGFRIARSTLLRRLDQSEYNHQDEQQIPQLVASLAIHALDYPTQRTDSP